MAQPTPYTPATDFSQQEANAASGRSTVSTAALDAELSAIAETIDQTLYNLAQIQRDDGALRNLSVHLETLAAEVRALLASGAFTIDPDDASWATGVEYEAGRVAVEGNAAYLCAVAHTSGAFSADLDAGKWVQIAPIVSTVAASGVDFTPSSTISSTNAQAAIEEVSRKARPAADMYIASTYGAL